MPPAISSFALPDHPLVDPAMDSLGRTVFAERIARTLQAWKGGAPLVVSLNGDCGAGKTTVKNFIRHTLAAGKTESGGTARPASTLEFDPREPRGAEEMVRAFRQQLATALRVPTESEETLREALQALPAPAVVFIDDVDCLAAPHIVTLMRTLEALGRLPNLVCFLVFQKNRVLSTLAGSGVDAAAEYLRKVIHLELELPEAPDALLRPQLESGLEALLGQVTFPPRPRDRWHDFFSSAVWPLFATPREVKRFLAAFAFQFDGFFRAAEGVLEVNSIDLVALEALRMFAPPVYSELRDTFRRRETRVVRFMSGRDEERKEMRLEIDQSVEQLALSPRHKRAVSAALQQLMPLGTGAVNGGREDWDRDLRFCSQRHVERYFHGGAINDAVPAHRLVAIARAMGDREKFEALLVRVTEEQMLPEVLDRLPSLIQGLPENQVTIGAVALCSICDQLPAHAPADLEARLVKLACELFAQVSNPLKRENIVAALLDDPARLTGPILLLQALRPRSDVTNGAAAMSLSIEQFRRLIKPAIAKLQENALAGTLWNSREAGTLIKRWWEWSGEKEEVQRWLLQQVKEPAHARAWLRSFLSASTSSPGREMLLQLEELGQYCDPNAVALSAAQATGDGIDRAAAKRLGQVLASKGSSGSFAVRAINVPLEVDGAGQ